MRTVTVLGVLVVAGLASMAWADCDDQSGNIFWDANCTFDLNTSGWTTVVGTNSHVAGDGFPVAGSMELVSGWTGATDAVQLTGPCRQTAGDTFTTLTTYLRLMSGSNVSCSPGVDFYSSSDCTSGGLGGWAPLTSPGAAWAADTDGLTPSSVFGAVASARYSMICFSSSGPFTVRFDHAWLRPGSMVPVELVAFEVE